MSQLLLSNHFREQAATQGDWDSATVGAKAMSLSALPLEWVPPFGVLATEVCRRWLSMRRRLDPVAAARSALVGIDRSGLQQLFRVISSDSDVIVRSSAPEEGMLERGRFESMPAHASFEGVAFAAGAIWEDASVRTHVGSLALLLQRPVESVSSGHLSNERRLSSRRTIWTQEFADSLGEVQVRTLSTSGVQPADIDGLLASDSDSVAQVLKRVAAYFTQQGGRWHIEWVWDGRRVWVVQADSEVGATGARLPGACYEAFVSANHLVTAPLPALRKLVPASICDGWPKAHVAALLSSMSLPTPELHALVGAAEIAAVSRGFIDSELDADLRELTSRAAVFRIDVRNTSTGFAHLSRRSDVLMDAEGAASFISKACKECLDGGVSADDICVLGHVFVRTYVCAYGFARPGDSRVRVDSSWGQPETLLYYAHDSFELSVDSDDCLLHVRGKTVFVDVDDEGHWSDVRCDQKMQWSQSLTMGQLRQIADITSILAQELDHPTKVMFFVGRGVGGDGEVLPWMWFDEDLPTEMPDVATPLGTRSIVVSSPADLEAARAIQERDGAHDIAIRVRPTVELLREREFVDELASFAKEHDSAVEIEGSILSHVFYMLNAAGVRVRCVDPLQAKQRSELFDKLVRDEIPEKIRRHGESVVARIAHGSELDRLLRQKAVEEALELNSAVDTQSSIEELADVLEVVRSLAENLGLDLDAIVDMADNKAATRGGFARGVVLLGTNRRPMLSQRHDRSGRIPETDVEPDWLGHTAAGLATSGAHAVGANSVAIPLVPPDGAGRLAELRVSRGGVHVRLRITYGSKDVLVEMLADDPDDPASGGQLSLVDM
jgi:predicted house-cleaning noncanonical NTP pyrophosphatase (MazG superfamily)